MDTAAEEANRKMVDRLIAQGALWSKPLIEAFRATPRHCFLMRVWQYQNHNGGWREVDALGQQELRMLYADRALTTHLSEPALGLPPVPISSSSQPSLMAEMLEDLRLAPGLKTLEIGTGTGYNAALLAHRVGRVRACWLGPREWRVTGLSGRALGEQLWHDFLDAGGPWPTEFHLRAVPLAAPSPSDEREGWSEAEADESDCLAFSRRGPLVVNGGRYRRGANGLSHRRHLTR